MKRKTRLIILAAMLVVPVLAFAQGLVPCSGARGDECQFCTMVQLITNVIDWLIAVLTVVVAIVFVAAGLRLVLSTGNTSEKEAAKKLISNTFIGFVIILACWLLVDLVMKMLLAGGGGNIGLGAAPGPWNAIQCEAQPQSREVVTSMGTMNGVSIAEECDLVGPGIYDCSAQGAACTAGGGTPTYNTSAPTHTVDCDYPAGAYAGSCDPITDTSNPCSPTNPDMIAAFGSRVNEAAIVCNKESGGAPVESGSDLCCGTDGSCSGAPSFSGGYFQINVLSEASRLPGCTPGAFYNQNGSSLQGNCMRRQGGAPIGDTSVPCTGWTCEITDTAMYNTCMSATLDSATNFAAAGELFDSRGFQPWSWSSNICGVPY